MFPLIRKCFHEAKWLFAACSTAVFAFCWLRVWIVSLVDTTRFKAILDMLPGDWQRFTPVDLEWLVTYEGRIALAYDELIVVACVAIWSIARGSDSVSGEVGRGTMEMLLSQPIGRAKLLWANACVTVFGAVFLAMAAWLGNWAGIHTTQVELEVMPRMQLPMHIPGFGSEVELPFAGTNTQLTPMTELIDPVVLLPATLNLAALGFMLCGFATLMSSWDRYRWRTIGIVIGLFVIQVMIKIAGMASDQWGSLLYFSILTAYEPEFMVRIADTAPTNLWAWQVSEGGATVFGPLAYEAVLLAVGAASYLLATIIFLRRDIPAPL